MVLAAIAAALGSCPAGASAGSYRVYSCVAPSGGPAPVGDGGYGWQPSGRSGPACASSAPIPTFSATAAAHRSASAERRPSAGVARRARGRYPSAVDQ